MWLYTTIYTASYFPDILCNTLSLKRSKMPWAYIIYIICAYITIEYVSVSARIPIFPAVSYISIQVPSHHQSLTCCWCCPAGCWGGRSSLGPPGHQCPLPQRVAPWAETLMAFRSVWDNDMAYRLASGTLRGQTQDKNTGCTRSMHPHGGAIGKHMAVGIQGKVSCQTTDLGSANHTEQEFEGTLLTLRLFNFFHYISLGWYSGRESWSHICVTGKLLP